MYIDTPTSRKLWSLAVAVAVIGCSSVTAPGNTPSGTAALDVTAVTPPNASVGVATNTPVVVKFSRPMMVGMEALVVLHEGAVTGPAVAGTAMWSSDRLTLTFTPAMPLKPATTYVLHMAPGLVDAVGDTVNAASCARLGGTSVSSSMMGAGTGMMSSGSWGPGMMGTGWQSATGTFGMIFTFKTS